MYRVFLPKVSQIINLNKNITSDDGKKGAKNRLESYFYKTEEINLQ